VNFGKVFTEFLCFAAPGFFISGVNILDYRM
jgi:hypothetical protein